MGNNTNDSDILMPHSVAQDLYIFILTCALIVCLIILTAIGNIMVLVAFVMCKELRSITNYFLVSLAIADLITALIAMPIFFLLRITNNQWDFPGGLILKNIFVAVDIISGTASIWNLCLISLDRFLAIKMPLKHMVILTPQRAQIVIVFVWGFSLVLCSLMFVNWQYKAYPIVTLSFLLPLIVILFSYVQIYNAMRNRTFVHRRRVGMKLKRDFRMAKQMILVIGSFSVCWFGFFTVNMILAASTSKRIVGPIVLNIVKVLTYLNSCLNPLLFTFISHKFKIAFTQMFHCRNPDLRKARILMSQKRDELVDSRYHSGLQTLISECRTTPLLKKKKILNESSIIERETTV